MHNGFRVQRRLYGLAASGDAWYKTIDHPLLKRLGMYACKLDKPLYYKHDKGKLIGLIGQYIDDSIECVNPYFGSSQIRYWINLSAVLGRMAVCVLQVLTYRKIKMY